MNRPGAGVGTALYREVLPLLEARGVRTVIAGIALPNEPSANLHERFGFRHAGVMPRVGFKHGEWRDVGYWVLHLGDGPPE